jgi:hypothetical protein
MSHTSKRPKIKYGDRFGKNKEWQVVQQLGHGAFGCVWKVVNRREDKVAALKAEMDDKDYGGSAIKMEVSLRL